MKFNIHPVLKWAATGLIVGFTLSGIYFAFANLLFAYINLLELLQHHEVTNVHLGWVVLVGSLLGAAIGTIGGIIKTALSQEGVG